MAGIDFTLLRRQVALAPVLDLVGFQATTRRGPQVRGACPLHGAVHGARMATAQAMAQGRQRPRRRRSFAAHLQKNCWHCFGCGACGNALDLYLAVTKLPVYQGALELCARLGLSVPRLRGDIPVRRRGPGGALSPGGQRSPP
jgi:hypothetical protein